MSRRPPGDGHPSSMFKRLHLQSVCTAGELQAGTWRRHTALLETRRQVPCYVADKSVLIGTADGVLRNP